MADPHRFVVESLEDLERAASAAVPPPKLGERALVRHRGRDVELEVVERRDAQVVWQQR